MSNSSRSPGRALIVGHPESREMLAGSRGLGQAGWGVGVGSSGPFDLARASIHTDRWHRIPPPDHGVDAFLAAVAQAVLAGGYDVVFGAGDPEVIALSAGRDELAASVPYAADAVVRRAIDKWSLHQAAVSVGLPVPHTVLATVEELARWTGPAMVKTRLHWHPGVGPAPVWIAAARTQSRATTASAVRHITSTGRGAILQRPVAGRLVSVTALRSPEGAMLGVLQQRARRTYPRNLGVSASAETVEIDQQLAGGVGALLDHLGWIGMAQLQFVESQEEGPDRHRLIDFNGRFYGSLGLALRAGVNFPAAWASVATGQDPAPLGPANVGTRYVWLEGDLRQALATPDRGRAVALVTVARDLPGAVHSICSAADPKPMLMAPLVRLHGMLLALCRAAVRRLAAPERYLAWRR